MYEVFKQVWNQGVATLQYVTEYPNLVASQTIAKSLKGVVKINGHICLDFRR